MQLCQISPVPPPKTLGIGPLVLCLPKSQLLRMGSLQPGREIATNSRLSGLSLQFGARVPTTPPSCQTPHAHRTIPPQMCERKPSNFRIMRWLLQKWYQPGITPSLMPE